MSTKKTNYPNDKIFGPLWLMFHQIGPTIHWEAYGTQEDNHKVYVTWRGQTHAIGFAHELCVLSKERLMDLLDIYFEEETNK